MPTTIPFINPYKSREYSFLSGGAIWLKELKQFAFYYKKSQFLLTELQGDFFIKESRCLNQSISRGFRGKPKLYDNKEKLVSLDLIKKLFVLGYEFEGDSIRFYFASDDQVSNFIDGVTIAPNYLVDYFKLHKKYSFLLRKKDLIDENGEIVYFQGSDTSGNLFIICPKQFPKEIEDKLRRKKMKFSDLPTKYHWDNYVGNVQFICPAGGSKTTYCTNPKDDEKWQEYLDKKYK